MSRTVAEDGSIADPTGSLTETRSPTDTRTPSVSRSMEESFILPTRFKFNSPTDSKTPGTKEKSPRSLSVSLTFSNTSSREKVSFSRSQSVEKKNVSSTPTLSNSKTAEKSISDSIERTKATPTTTPSGSYSPSRGSTPSKSVTKSKSTSMTDKQEKSYSDTNERNMTQQTRSKVMTIEKRSRSATPSLTFSESRTHSQTRISIFVVLTQGYLVSTDTVRRQLRAMYNLTSAFSVQLVRERPTVIMQLAFPEKDYKAVDSLQTDFKADRLELSRMGFAALTPSYNSAASLITPAPIIGASKAENVTDTPWFYIAIAVGGVIILGLVGYCLFAFLKTRRKQHQEEKRFEELTHVFTEQEMAPLPTQSRPDVTSSRKHTSSMAGKEPPSAQKKGTSGERSVQILDGTTSSPPRTMRVESSSDSEAEEKAAPPPKRTAQGVRSSRAVTEVLKQIPAAQKEEHKEFLQSTFTDSAAQEGFDCPFALGCMKGGDLPWLIPLAPPGFLDNAGAEARKSLRSRPKEGSTPARVLASWFPHRSAVNHFTAFLERHDIHTVADFESCLDEIDLEQDLEGIPLGHKRSIQKVVEAMMV
eukprot:PhF_6_TR9251/c1_g1_i1/m.14643